MTDLFVYTADRDAQAVVQAVLKKLPMIKDGPETVRWKVKKNPHGKVILMWDHHGSGLEQYEPQRTERELGTRLEQCTWAGRSAAIAIVSELEEWLWHDSAAICKFYKRKHPDLAKYLQDAKTAPKEALVALQYESRRAGKLTAADFEVLAGHANHRPWRSSPSLDRFMNTLEQWFPQLKEHS